MKKPKILLFVMLASVLFFFVININRCYCEKQDVAKEILIELFVLDPCESCREGAKFEEVLRNELSGKFGEKRLVYHTYNVFQTDNRGYMHQRLIQFGIEAELSDLPFAVVDGRLYKGSYDEIAIKIRQAKL